jgi:hypothetical protein
VTGILPVANGGTNLSSYTINGVLYASGTGTLANSSAFVFDGTNVGIGTTTPSTYGKFVVGGTGSFTSALVSTSTTLTDRPTLEFRKTATGTTSGVTNNQIGRISFYSQSGSSGTTTTESAYITAKEYRVSNIGFSELEIATYVSSVSVKTNYVILSTNGLDLYSGGTNGISYTGDQHIFNGPAFFNDDIDCGVLDAGTLTVNAVPVATTTGSQTLTNKTLASNTIATTQSNGDNSTKLATTAYVQNMGLGLSQTWTDVTASRALGTTYTNTTGKPIQIIVSGNTGGGSSGGSIYITVGGITVHGNWAYSGSVPAASVAAIVPSGVTYSAFAGGSISLASWAELR